MRSARRREVGLAVALSGVAGYLDAVGFLELGGLFVSFMSGNTTELASSIGSSGVHASWTAAVILGSFFAGAAFGALVARFGDSRVRVLTATALLLAVTSATAAVADGHWPVAVGLPFAMATMNATFLHRGEVSIGLTYMTGTLVKAGQRLVDAFTGGPRLLWLRHLSLWFALAAGGVLGASTHSIVGRSPSLWFATAAVAAVTGVTLVVRRRTAPPQPGPPTIREERVI